MPNETKTEKENSDTDHKQNLSNSSWRKIIFELARWEAALTIATIFLAFYTYKLWDATHDLLIDAKETAIRQTADMQESLHLTRQAADAATSSVAVTQQLAAAAAIQANASAKTASISDKEFIASQRAWVGPVNISLSSELSKSRPIDFAIQYQNSGREPAINFNHSIRWFIFDGSKQHNSIDEMKYCLSQSKAGEGVVVYPAIGTSNSYTMHATIDQSAISDQVMSGDHILEIHGCFTYKTMDKIRHSYFCYLYKNGTTKISNLTICPIGQKAD